MNTNQRGGKVSRSVQRDFRETSGERFSGRHQQRQQQVEDHRNGVDHGRGCVHCDVTHGR